MKLISIPITGGPLNGNSVDVNANAIMLVVRMTDTFKYVYVGYQPGVEHSLIGVTVTDAAALAAVSGEPFLLTTGFYLNEDRTMLINKLWINYIYDASQNSGPNERWIFVRTEHQEIQKVITPESLASLRTKWNASNWTVSNVTPSRTLNATSVTLAQLSQNVGTLIQDLQARRDNL